jgi:rhodanese-related sulfurtransferase
MSHDEVPARSNPVKQPAGERTFRCCLLSAAVVALLGCQGSGSGGGQATGGAVGTGGAQSTGGALGSGGAVSSGGAQGTGGTVGSGGMQSIGGVPGSGGTRSSGGASGTGGTRETGGALGLGGVQGTGGGFGSGGAPGTGGKFGSGGAVGTGGRGGAPGTGGTQGTPDAGRDSAACTGSSTLVHLTPQQFKDLLAAQDVYLVNVRSPTAPDIAGTDLDLQTSTDVTPTVTAIENLVNHNLCADIVIYCVSGGISQRVGAQLISLGYLSVRDLQGGITAWQAQGFPVVQAGGGPG